MCTLSDNFLYEQVQCDTSCFPPSLWLPLRELLQSYFSGCRFQYFIRLQLGLLITSDEKWTCDFIKRSYPWEPSAHQRAVMQVSHLVWSWPESHCNPSVGLKTSEINLSPLGSSRIKSSLTEDTYKAIFFQDGTRILTIAQCWDFQLPHRYMQKESKQSSEMGKEQLYCLMLLDPVMPGAKWDSFKITKMIPFFP